MSKSLKTKNSKKKTSLTHDVFINEVKKRAYEIYTKREDGQGTDVSDWFKAENEIKVKHNIK